MITRNTLLENNLQINGQKILPQISENLTYFHNLTLRILFLKGPEIQDEC